MSARTAPHHTPAELALLSCDDTTGIVVFIARSRHNAARGRRARRLGCRGRPLRGDLAHRRATRPLRHEARAVRLHLPGTHRSQPGERPDRAW